MAITKLSDVRVSSIPELQAFLKEKGIPFETDNNKARLQELAREFFKPKDESLSDEEKGADTDEKVEDQPQGGQQEDPKDDASDAQDAPEANADAGEQAGNTSEDTKKEEEKPLPPAPTPEEQQKTQQDLQDPFEDRVNELMRSGKAKSKSEARRLALQEQGQEQSEKERDEELGKVPGTRRDLPLDALLAELARKGFSSKQELADLLEATVREQKRLAGIKGEHDRREEAIEAGEIKLAQRVKDFDAECVKIHKDKLEAQNLLEQAVKIQQDIARAKRG